jgi:TolA-binding protein
MLCLFRSTRVILFGFLILLCGTSSAMAAGSDDRATGAEVKQEVREALQSIGSYTAEQRDAAVAAAKDALAKTDARIEQLQRHIDQNWQQMSQATREQSRATLKTLQQQRTDIAEWYGGLKHSSANAWDEIKKGFAKSYSDLEKSLEKARAEY